MKEINWERFIKFQPLSRSICSQLVREGLPFDEVENVLFNIFLKKSKRGVFINRKFITLDAIRKLTPWSRDKKEISKIRELKQSIRRAKPVDLLEIRRKRGPINDYKANAYYKYLTEKRTPYSILDKKEKLDLVFSRVATYSPKLQKLFDLILDEKSAEEISKELNYSVKWVYFWKTRIFKDLRHYVRWSQLPE